VPALTVLTFWWELGVIGAQTSANALAAIFYPTAMLLERRYLLVLAVAARS
jgi:hypothetical protein